MEMIRCENCNSEIHEQRCSLCNHIQRQKSTTGALRSMRRREKRRLHFSTKQGDDLRELEIEGIIKDARDLGHNHVVDISE